MGQNRSMKQLNLGTIQVPISAATKTFAILAKRGAGKSYTAAVLAEEFFKAGIPFVAIDPIDVWYGLRVAANGKGSGLPIVVFGARNADIPLTREMGRDIAKAIVRDNVSCVISTYGLPKVAYRHLVAEFAEELLAINNTPRHIFVEEAHEFVPQRVFGAMNKVFSAVESLVVMGRNKGIGVTLINQRAATVNKDVLTQLDTLLAFRNIAPQDRKALKEWVEAHSAEGDFESFMASLPSLPTGEGWIWSPEFLGVFKRIKIRKRETFHPDLEKIGASFQVPKIEQADVQEFIERFKKVSKDDAEKTQSKEKSSYPSQPLATPDFDEAIRVLRNEYESKIIEKDAEIRKMQAIINGILRELSVFLPAKESAGTTITSVGYESNLMLQKLGGMAQKVYKILLDHPSGLTKRQIALMLGYAVTSGSFSNALSKLRTMGLTKKSGDFEIAIIK